MASSEGPKKNCGNYGGEDCEATKEINTVALEGQKLIDNMGAGAVALKSADEQSKLAKKGSSATIKDAETTRKEMAQFAAWKSTGTTALITGMASLQARRANLHKKSAQNIEIEANRRLVENNEKMATLEAAINGKSGCGNVIKDDTDCTQSKARLVELENQNKNILNNSELEIAAQRGARAKANMGAVVTSITASKHAFEAARLGMVANSDLLSETTASAPTFSITQNSGEVIHNPDGQGTNPTPESAAVNVTDTGDKPNDKFDGGLNDFNPNFNDQTLTGNLPSGEGGAVNAPGAQGGGSGAGGAGGTSAANDSGGGGPEGPTGKTQAGKYESGEGGGSRFSRGGGSAVGGKSVGMDDGFADLLKKFLPGAQEERAPAEGEAVADANDDRTPASDRASVISREKNIFKEISKRYLKKNSEGSVLFQ